MQYGNSYENLIFQIAALKIMMKSSMFIALKKYRLAALADKLNHQETTHGQLMKKQKSVLQKASKIIGITCFFLSVVCAVTLYIKLPELGVEHPISASLIASIFFFIFIGFVFTVIANTDTPSFKFAPAIPDTDRSKDV